MSSPLVSVLIPAFNKPDYLQLGLESVLAQTYDNLEIIICDDSINEGVEKIVAPYLLIDQRIKYYRNPTRLFIINRHRCFELASGEFINYLMDDDLFHKEKIAKMLSAFAEHENVTLVTSHRDLIDEQGNILPTGEHNELLYPSLTVVDGFTLGNRLLTSLKNDIGEPTTVLFRKQDLMEKFGVYKGKQFLSINDFASWLSLLSKGKAVYLPETLSYFRIHDNQEHKSFNLGVICELLDLIVCAKKDGFLSNKELCKKALLCYKERVLAFYSHASPAVKERFDHDLSLVDNLVSHLGS